MESNAVKSRLQIRICSATLRTDWSTFCAHPQRIWESLEFVRHCWNRIALCSEYYRLSPPQMRADNNNMKDGKREDQKQPSFSAKALRGTNSVPSNFRKIRSLFSFSSKTILSSAQSQRKSRVGKFDDDLYVHFICPEHCLRSGCIPSEDTENKSRGFPRRLDQALRLNWS